MNLTAEQLSANWDKFLSYIDNYIEEPRKTALKAFYEKYAERIILMPASHKKEYHNSFPGGYVEHVNRVIDASLEFDKLWIKFGVVRNYTTEELVFSAMNHDLGKLGDEENESYLPQTDQWRKDKLGENYMFNDKLEFMSVPDRGLWLLNQHGISYSKNEMLAIKLHDGIYDEANKPYLLSWRPETKPRTSIMHILHQADFMAARVEFEREWMTKLTGKNAPKKVKDNTPKPTTKTKALSSIESQGLKKAMDSFFNE